jgi:alkylated DNA nucleotide flippase Atl1
VAAATGLAVTGVRAPGPSELPDFASRVLEVADAIPPGRVMSYGDIAEFLGEAGPRQVGRVMAVWGGGVPWWRVVHADGSFLRGHEREALARYQREGTALRHAPDGSPLRVDMSAARWTPPGGQLAAGGPAGIGRSSW